MRCKWRWDKRSLGGDCTCSARLCKCGPGVMQAAGRYDPALVEKRSCHREEILGTRDFGGGGRNLPCVNKVSDCFQGSGASNAEFERIRIVSLGS